MGVSLSSLQCPAVTTFLCSMPCFMLTRSRSYLALWFPWVFELLEAISLFCSAIVDCNWELKESCFPFLHDRHLSFLLHVSLPSNTLPSPSSPLFFIAIFLHSILLNSPFCLQHYLPAMPSLFSLPRLWCSLHIHPPGHHSLSSSCPHSPDKGWFIDLLVMPECLWRLRSTRAKHPADPQNLTLL